MKLSTLFIDTSQAAPEGTGIFVLQDDDGWYWLKKRVLHEGFATPFCSIEEIEVYLGMPRQFHSISIGLLFLAEK